MASKMITEQIWELHTTQQHEGQSKNNKKKTV